MPEFLPFVGTRFNRSKVSLATVTSPPYDVISNEYRDALYLRDEHNIVRIDFSRESDPYANASQLLSLWKEQGIFLHDATPAFYVYRQIFDVPDSREVTRTGVIGRIKVSPYQEKQIIPHERTNARAKRDRLHLMEETSANLSPIFGLIADESFAFDQTLEVAMVQPALADIQEVLPDGQTVRHLLWGLDDPVAADRISRIIHSRSVTIADGHHRYETALEYHRLHPETAQAGYVMTYLTNLRSPGTIILPTHRLLHSVPGFDQYLFLDALKARFELLVMTSREEGMAALERDVWAVTLLEFPEEPKFVLLRDETNPVREVTADTLPVSRLDREIFRETIGLSDEAIAQRTNLFYPHTPEELDELKETRAWDVAFFLRAVTPEELMTIVGQGSFLPQKATYFYPKLLTGLVIHEFEQQ